MTTGGGTETPAGATVTTRAVTTLGAARGAGVPGATPLVLGTGALSSGQLRSVRALGRCGVGGSVLRLCVERLTAAATALDRSDAAPPNAATSSGGRTSRSVRSA